MSRNRYEPSPADCVQLAAACVVDPRTVRRAYKGHCLATTHARVTRAALALGMPPPQPATMHEREVA